MRSGKLPVISRSEARAVALRHGLLADGPAGSESPDARAAAVVSRLGHVQIDTISVVERAHVHTLWSRDRRADAGLFAALETNPRRIFEYWAHAAAYLPLDDYRFSIPRMRRIAKQGHEWYSADKAVTRRVLARIKAEGPLKSADFEHSGERGPWWDWKPAKRSLEYLFHAGKLMVVSRPGFQKLYDLTERVLPPGLDMKSPGLSEQADFHVLGAMRSLGVFSLREVGYQRKDGVDGMDKALGRAVTRGELVEVSIDGIDEPSYMDPSEYAAADRAGEETPRDGAERPVRILSPFDPVIIDRKRLSRLFGFDYTIECYVPEAKRRFGYFALPVLFGTTVGGLIDCKADRKAGLLTVKRSAFYPTDAKRGGPGAAVEGERGLGKLPGEWRAAFKDELRAFAVFCGCGEFFFE